MDYDELAEAIEMSEEEGYVIAVCDVCGAEAQIEADGNYSCLEEGCCGRVVSPLVKAGII